MSSPTVLQVVKSVLSAFIGVQSTKKRQLDFEKGTFAAYVIAGIVFTAIFVGGIIFVVSVVLG
jgi:hypothetical protein